MQRPEGMCENTERSNLLHAWGLITCLQQLAWWSQVQGCRIATLWTDSIRFSFTAVGMMQSNSDQIQINLNSDQPDLDEFESSWRSSVTQTNLKGTQFSNLYSLRISDRESENLIPKTPVWLSFPHGCIIHSWSKRIWDDNVIKWLPLLQYGYFMLVDYCFQYPQPAQSRVMLCVRLWEM